MRSWGEGGRLSEDTIPRSEGSIVMPLESPRRPRAAVFAPTWRAKLNGVHGRDVEQFPEAVIGSKEIEVRQKVTHFGSKRAELTTWSD